MLINKLSFKLNHVWTRVHCLRSFERSSKAWYKISIWDFAKKTISITFLFIIHVNLSSNIILSYLFKYYSAILNNSPVYLLTIKYTIVINNKLKSLPPAEGPRTLKSFHGRIANTLFASRTRTGRNRVMLPEKVLDTEK